jgi:GT2 family glycosyltransferase
MIHNLAIGLLAFSHPEHIKASLFSIQANNHPEIPTYLLQNGLGDDDFNKLLSAFQWVNGIFNSVNLGAAGGRNRLLEIIKTEGYEFAFLLDSDAIVGDDAIEKLMVLYPELSNPGVVSCLVMSLESQDKVLSSGVNFNINPPWELTFYKDVLSESYIQVPIVLTIAVLISCLLEPKTPNFDERYYVYWEDADWCLNYIANGYNNYVCREAVVYHSSVKSHFTPPVVYYMTRNQVLFIMKHGKGKNFKNWLSFLFSTEARLLRRIRSITPMAFTCFIAGNLGLFHAWIDRWGKAPNWMYKPNNKYIEYKLINLWLIPQLRTLKMIFTRTP